LIYFDDNILTLINYFISFVLRPPNTFFDSARRALFVAMHTALHIACAKGDMSKARALIEDGADIDCQNVHGMTPLHISCFQKTPALSNFLIDKRADVNVVNYKRDTALSLACHNLCTDIIPTLLKEGADPFAGAGLFKVPVSCARLVSLNVARSGRCAFCGTPLSLPLPIV
jgi:hypothetical protein